MPADQDAEVTSAYLTGPAAFTFSDSILAFVSSWGWITAGEIPPFLLRGLSGDFLCPPPESLLSVERTEVALFDVLEPDGRSFSWCESSRSSDSATDLGFSSGGALLHNQNKKGIIYCTCCMSSTNSWWLTWCVEVRNTCSTKLHTYMYMYKHQLRRANSKYTLYSTSTHELPLQRVVVTAMWF